MGQGWSSALVLTGQTEEGEEGAGRVRLRDAFRPRLRLLRQRVRHGLGDAELGNLLLLGLDQRLELRQFYRVATLLVLAVAEDVGVVLRPPVVKEVGVLGDDDLAEALSLLAGTTLLNPATLVPLLGGRSMRRVARTREGILSGCET